MAETQPPASIYPLTLRTPFTEGVGRHDFEHGALEGHLRPLALRLFRRRVGEHNVSAVHSPHGLGILIGC